MIASRRLLPALVLVFGFTACSGAAAVVESVDAHAAAAILEEDQDAILLDIRTPAEFAEVRIDGATNIDFSAADFADRLADLDPDGTYVIYCRSGNRTTAALEIFADLGFTAVHAVDGGILAWEAAGFAVLRG
jgi:rhodanese-related sulfurtransferase